MEEDIKSSSKTNVHKICSGQVASTSATAVKELVEINSDTSAVTIDLKGREVEKIKCDGESKNSEECCKRKRDMTISDNQDNGLSPPSKNICKDDSYSVVTENEEINDKKSDKVQDFPHSSNSSTSPVNNPSKIQVGTSDFGELVQKDGFIDKSMLIKSFIESSYGAILITPPKRSGRTTNLNMIKAFLEIEVDENGNQKSPETKKDYKLFTEGFKGKKLKISKHKEFIKKYLGQYPVIFVSFAEVKGKNYDEIFDEIKVAIINSFKQHKYMINVFKKQLTSDNVGIYWKAKNSLENFEKFYNSAENTSLLKTRIDIVHSLNFLSEVLYEKFEKRAYVLVDEYDTPINSISNSNIKHHDDIREVDFLIESVLGYALKGNQYLNRGLMTGISWYIPNTAGSSPLNSLCRDTDLEQNFIAQ